MSAHPTAEAMGREAKRKDPEAFAPLASLGAYIEGVTEERARMAKHLRERAQGYASGRAAWVAQLLNQEADALESK